MKQAMRQSVGIFILIFLFGLMTMPVTAQARKVATASSQRAENRLETIKARGNVAIDTRIASLNSITQNLPTLKFLPSDTQAALLGEVATTSASLQSLKTTLNADTQADQALKDYRKIYTDHRVYMVVIPKVRAHVTIERMLAHITRQETFGLKLQSRIQKANDNGVNVTELTNQYNQYVQKVALAKSKTNTAQALLRQLTVANANAGTSKQTVQVIKTNLRDAFILIQDAQKIARMITSGLTSSVAKPNTATQSAPLQSRTATPAARRSAKP